MTYGFSVSGHVVRRLERRPSWRRRAAVVTLAIWPLTGCVSTGAPAIPLFGAYFPSWLLAALLGIVGAVIVRLLFVRIGIDDALPVRLPVYVCIAAAIGFAISLLGFGR